jgi:hypothetical protein
MEILEVVLAGAGNDDFATRSQQITSLEPVSDRTPVRSRSFRVLRRPAPA